MGLASARKGERVRGLGGVLALPGGVVREEPGEMEEGEEGEEEREGARTPEREERIPWDEGVVGEGRSVRSERELRRELVAMLDAVCERLVRVACLLACVVDFWSREVKSGCWSDIQRKDRSLTAAPPLFLPRAIITVALLALWNLVLLLIPHSPIHSFQKNI